MNFFARQGGTRKGKRGEPPTTSIVKARIDHAQILDSFEEFRKVSAQAIPDFLQLERYSGHSEGRKQ
jgi:hypothetical protein